MGTAEPELTPDVPFKIFRNYDDAGAEFGDTSLAATSADQFKLAIYAARRTADHTITVVVINKTFGDLRADLPIDNFKAEGRRRLIGIAVWTSHTFARFLRSIHRSQVTKSKRAW